ncbi:MAG: hypothetical protein WB441_04330 [Nocardioidaceae bacterium]
MRLWRLLGVAGLAGVAATGAIIARDQRQRSSLTPDEVRARLHERVAAQDSATPGGATDGPGSTESNARA